MRAAALLFVLSLPSLCVEARLGVRVRMRDGVKLSTNIFLPAAAGRYSTILVRTPYGKGRDLLPNWRAFVDNGYAFVTQDVRGRYLSEGLFDPLRQEPADGDDTLNWIGTQPWSDGKVGMIGGSYLGIVQWKVATLNNPYLKAISPVVSGYDDYRDRFYSTGGAMKLGNRLLWMSDNMRAPGFRKPHFQAFTQALPLRSADRAATGQTIRMFQNALEHPAYDDFWKSISTREKLDSIRIPVLSVSGWYDNFVQSDLEAFSYLKKNRREASAVIGPWPHNMSIPFEGVQYGPDASAPVRRYQLDWFDYWLKGNRSKRLPAPLQIFVMGKNGWRDEKEWPLKRAVPTPYYLSSRQGANSIDGDGMLATRPGRREGSDTFVYDPRKPVPTHGGAVCCNPKVFPWGPLDQRVVEQRDDVLVYTSEELKKDVEATGPVRVELWVSTTAPDTDFTAKLVDVFPNGEARLLTDGILRLRYRASLEKPVPAKPGETYMVSIDAGVTSNVFQAGHRIRLEVSSSNFPRFDRNPNTGRPVADETELRVATQRVFHGAQRRSRVVLLVVR
jgi:putative CocE/NonD family hydrolase